jgi:hypothetical protein
MKLEQQQQVYQCLNSLKPVNLVVQTILNETRDKYDTEEIRTKPPGIMFYPKASFGNRGLSVWYFIPNQQNDFLEREWLEEIMGKPLEFMAYGERPSPIESPINLLLLQNVEMIKDMVKEKLDKLLAEKKPAVLLHLSDEILKDSLDLYDHPAVKLVIRNYLRPDIKNADKVITIPLGYVKNRSLKGTYKKASERKLKWSFAGSIDKADRMSMLQSLAVVAPNSIKLLSTWKHPLPEEAPEYLATMGDSVFIPCPKGQNFETYRLYEALEAGCIPMCVEDPKGEHTCYTKLMGNTAILTMPDWNVVRQIILQNSSDELINQLQENLHTYWISHKASLTANIVERLEKILQEEQPRTIHL